MPTISESGLKGYEVTVWQGIVAPAGTPPSIIAQLNSQIAKILLAPEMRERLAAQGLEPAANQPEQFGAQIAADAAKWAKVIRHAGITAD